jgi:hypothetical protein
MRVPRVRFTVRRMMVAVLFVVIAVLFAGVVYLSLPRTVTVARLGPPYRVEIPQAGKHVPAHSVAAGSVQEQAISRWIQSHRSGWRLDFVSYVPVRRIKGDRFDLNFLKGICVLNYQEKPNGSWVQMSRPIAYGDELQEVFTEGQSEKLSAPGADKTLPQL